MIASIRKLHPLFGAELNGISAKAPLSAPEREALRRQIAKYGLVLLRGEQVTEDSFIAFSQSLGPVWNFASAASDKPQQASPRVFDFTNRGKQGEALPITDPAVAYLKVNELWHTDSTYVRPGAAISMLAAHILPATGGETEFCDTRVAYEGLAPSLHTKVRGLKAYHSLRYSMARVGFASANELGDALKREAIPHSLVRRHMQTGRDALLLASHIGEIDGMSRSDAEVLLADLMHQATVPERVYVHRWQRGDILIWDNFCTMHRATPFDSENSVRSMWSMRIVEEEPSVPGPETHAPDVPL
jgi:alpha-ketoglutarate-dependent 2,4-dichlorophenoxyacetate dioxygenase